MWSTIISWLFPFSTFFFLIAFQIFCQKLNPQWTSSLFVVSFGLIFVLHKILYNKWLQNNGHFYGIETNAVPLYLHFRTQWPSKWCLMSDGTKERRFYAKVWKNLNAHCTLYELWSLFHWKLSMRMPHIVYFVCCITHLNHFNSMHCISFSF